MFEVLTVAYTPENGAAAGEFYVTLTGRATGSIWRSSFEAGAAGAEPEVAFVAPGTGPTSFFKWVVWRWWQLRG